ncbi:MAG TPA: nuclear transport factor 2 family protein [Thermoanaerobaculia bacterium]
MSDHLATATAIYEAFGRGDIPGLLEHISDDVQWEAWADNTAQKAGVGWMVPRRGKAGVAEFFQVVAEELDIQEFQVLSLMAGGNQVAAEFVISANLKKGEGSYRDEEMHLWTFGADGKVVRLRHYLDTAKHVAAWATRR